MKQENIAIYLPVLQRFDSAFFQTLPNLDVHPGVAVYHTLKIFSNVNAKGLLMPHTKFQVCTLKINAISCHRKKKIPSLLNRSVHVMSLLFSSSTHSPWYSAVNTLRQRQNGRHFADYIFKCIFLNENIWIPIKISLKFVPKGPINNILSLVQMMFWRRPGAKPLSEPMMVSLLTHICVTRPQWVKNLYVLNIPWM